MYSSKGLKQFLILIILLASVQTMLAQCKTEGNPNKWLYKNGLGKYKVSYPKKVDYATKITNFFDAFVFMGMYSFTRAGNDRMFYIQFWGPASYPYDVMESDSLEFCFSDRNNMKLPPQTAYPGNKGSLIAFYKLNREFLDKMEATNLDSVVLHFTPRVENPEKEKKMVYSFTFKKFSDKHIRLLKEYAGCFRKQF